MNNIAKARQGCNHAKAQEMLRSVFSREDISPENVPRLGGHNHDTHSKGPNIGMRGPHDIADIRQDLRVAHPGAGSHEGQQHISGGEVEYHTRDGAANGGKPHATCDDKSAIQGDMVRNKTGCNGEDKGNSPDWCLARVSSHCKTLICPRNGFWAGLTVMYWAMMGSV